MIAIGRKRLSRERSNMDVHHALVVAVHSTVPTRHVIAPSTQSMPPRDAPTWTDRWLVYAGLAALVPNTVLAFVTGLLFWVTRSMANETRRLAGETARMSAETAALAAETHSAYKLSDEQHQQSLWPYCVVANWSILSETDCQLRYEVTVRNVGSGIAPRVKIMPNRVETLTNNQRIDVLAFDIESEIGPLGPGDKATAEVIFMADPGTYQPPWDPKAVMPPILPYEHLHATLDYTTIFDTVGTADWSFSAEGFVYEAGSLPRIRQRDEVT